MLLLIYNQQYLKRGKINNKKIMLRFSFFFSLLNFNFFFNPLILRVKRLFQRTSVHKKYFIVNLKLLLYSKNFTTYASKKVQKFTYKNVAGIRDMKFGNIFLFNLLHVKMFLNVFVNMSMEIMYVNFCDSKMHII